MNLQLVLLCLASTSAAIALPSFPTQTSPPTFQARDTTTPIVLPTLTGYFVTTKYDILPGVTNGHVTIPEKTITLVLPTCIQTITPDKNGYVPPNTCKALYDYYPSTIAAVVTTIIFGVLVFCHIGLAAKWKANYCWVLIMGALWETLSFLFRTFSTRYQQNSGLELIASLFVLLAPLWINAHSYITLSHLLHTYHPTHSIFHISASTLSALFVTLDFISFVIQLTGGSYASSTSPPAQQLKGIHIYMGGIGFQQSFICIFIILVVKFQLEMTMLERGRILEKRTGWKKLVLAIYLSLTFITIRILFRFIQFSSGNKTASNPLIGQEGYFYALEATPMICAITVFVIVHPGPIVNAKVPGIWATIKGCVCGRRVNAEGEAGIGLTEGRYIQFNSEV